MKLNLHLSHSDIASLRQVNGKAYLNLERLPGGPYCGVLAPNSVY